MAMIIIWFLSGSFNILFRGFLSFCLLYVLFTFGFIFIMLTLIEGDVPEFLIQRNAVAYCSQLHVKNSNSSLVLSRNLKFYEFRKKELVHHIDLKSTCLQRLATQLHSYSGPINSFLIREDVADISGDSTSYRMLHAVEELPLSIGKYVWMGEHIFVLLRCWHTLLVLRRPNEYGASFELIAHHEDIDDYRLVKGPIKYQAYVELHFVNGKRQRTNFQSSDSSDKDNPATVTNGSSSSLAGFERLMQRVHGARAELHCQRTQTQQDFMRAQEQQVFGVPGQRSVLLEEKQLLRRCGDVWMRICGEALVLGTLLTNTSGNSRSSTLHAIRPLLQLSNDTAGLNYVHRLYELPLQADGQPPEDYNELAQFWACQDQFSIALSWRPTSQANQLPPERSAVLLVRLQLTDLLAIEQIQLLALYQLQSDAKRQQHLQLQLASINVAKLLQQQELHTPSFATHTLHQDFLAVVMTQTAHCVLHMQFVSLEQQMQFEQLLISKLKFVAALVPQEQQQAPQQQQQQQQTSKVQPLDELSTPHDFGFGDSSNSSSSCSPKTVQRIFYNPQSQLLLLRKDPDQQWHIYASNQTQLSLLVRRLLRELLQLNCNLSLLELHEEVCSIPANAALLLESALRDELQAKLEIVEMQTSRAEFSASDLKRLHQLEMASDLLVTVIKGQMPQLETN